MRLLLILVISCFLAGQEVIGQNWQGVSSEFFAPFAHISSFHEDTMNNGLYVGGRFTSIGNNPSMRGIALWKNGQWQSLANGLNSYINPAGIGEIEMFQGDIYAGGFLSDADGLECNGIAQWNGQQWFSVGDGVTHADGNPGQAWGMRVIDDELYVCGRFVSAGGVSVNGFAKWDGTSWSDVHDFPFFDDDGDVIHDCIMYNGELYVCGQFFAGVGNGILGLAKWDGGEWVGTGEVGVSGSCMEVYKGRLYIGGDFYAGGVNPYMAGNHIASWDGTSWDDVGGGIGNHSGKIRDMIVHDDLLYVIGGLTEVGGVPVDWIATWDGEQWCDLGTTSNNSITGIGVFQDTVHIGGAFSELNGLPINGLAKAGGSAIDENCGTLASIDGAKTEDDELAAYPNPTNSTVTVNLPKNNQQKEVWVNLHDVHGRLLAVPTINRVAEIELDLSNLPTGMYFGQVVLGKELRTFKVVRE